MYANAAARRPVTASLRPATSDPAVSDRVEWLVVRAARGDRAAFDELYACTIDRVYAVCLRLSGERAAAERLTQDTYVRAWQKLRTFRADAAFTTWLHRLAVNVVLGELRQARRRAARELSFEEEDAGALRAHAPEPGLRLDLERAIATLPAGARAVLVLHDIEGYRHDEIAQLLGIASGTAKAQLHRARRLLQERLNR